MSVANHIPTCPQYLWVKHYVLIMVCVNKCFQLIHAEKDFWFIILMWK